MRVSVFLDGGLEEGVRRSKPFLLRRSSAVFNGERGDDAFSSWIKPATGLPRSPSLLSTNTVPASSRTADRKKGIVFLRAIVR